MTNTATTEAVSAPAKKFLPITGWIPTSEATDMIKNYIASDEFDIHKGDIKKSSYRFANGKDKTDGYICKVMLLAEKCQNEEDEVEAEAEAETVNDEEVA